MMSKHNCSEGDRHSRLMTCVTHHSVELDRRISSAYDCRLLFQDEHAASGLPISGGGLLAARDQQSMPFNF
jgi:hypothetical protein